MSAESGQTSDWNFFPGKIILKTIDVKPGKE